MILEQQNKLLHSYYQLESKYKETAKENKFIKNEFASLKKRLESNFYIKSQLTDFMDVSHGDTDEFQRWKT